MISDDYKCVTVVLAVCLFALMFVVSVGPDIHGYLERKRREREESDRAIQEDREIERKVRGE